MKLRLMMLTLFCIFVQLNAGKAAYALMSIEDEKKMRAELLEQVQKRAPLVKDIAVTSYVKKIANKVLASVENKYFDYEFFVLKDDALNAFAMPGGVIFVHSGLIEALDTEDDLACVLAHEIGHVQARHIAKRLETMKYTGIATAITAVAGLFLGGGGQAGSAAIIGAGALSTSLALKYSREDEEEADRRACQWLCKAGYDPAGLANVMKKIMQFRWIGGSAIPSYLSTHPSSSQRLSYLEDILLTKKCEIQGERNLAALKYLQLKLAAVNSDPYELIEKYREKLREKPNDLPELYGLALALKATQQLDEAVFIFEKLLAISVADKDLSPMVHTDYGETLLLAGKYEKAIDLLSSYVQKNSDDIAALYQLARAWQRQGNCVKTMDILNGIDDKLVQAEEAFLMQGKCLVAQDKMGEGHYFFYKYYKAIGDMKTARFHRKKALALLPTTHKYVREIEEDIKKGKPDSGIEDEENENNTRKSSRRL